MLAYELYHNNKNSTANNPKNQFPIKKIFYKKGKITIDKTTLQDYGSGETETTKQLQNWLVMPLNTIDFKKLNLPDYRTGSAGANPYIEIYGKLTNKSLESTLVLSIGKKPNSIEYNFDVTGGKIQKTFDGKVILKLDQKNYFLKSNSLFSEYINSGIIDEKCILNAKVYDEIIQKFLEFVKKQESNFTKIGKDSSFRIYILPDNSAIEFKKESKKNNSKQESFVDYFGNISTNYASTPTKTAKFLSYNDDAFTINCMQEINFYQNLGIGNTSLEKIYTDASQTFKIKRLDWTFTDISNPDSKFIETKKGILTQLYQNYHTLSKDKGSSIMAQLKVICIRINQAKQEVLIDENLTMDKMNQMFANIKEIPPLCFEKVLIDTSGQNPIWNTYLYVVRNFLAGNKIQKRYLLSFF